jgi:hypothetical protein
VPASFSPFSAAITEYTDEVIYKEKRFIWAQALAAGKFKIRWPYTGEVLLVVGSLQSPQAVLGIT